MTSVSKRAKSAERPEPSPEPPPKPPLGLPPDLNVIWAPHEGSQAAFLANTDFEVLYHGTRGGGKTDALLMSFAQFIGSGYGTAWKGVIFRTHAADLGDLIDKSENWFHSIFPGAVYNKAKYMWKFKEGEQLLFRHILTKSDYYRYHGHAYPFIGWEELTTWGEDSLYKTMMSCCRSSNIGVPKMIRATTNPYGIGHNWVKERFKLYGDYTETKRFKSGVSTHRSAIYGHMNENRHLMEATPDYAKTIEENCDNEAQLKAWSLGSWDIVAGGLFSDVWDPSIHVLEPFAIPETWRIDRSFDWGSSAPFSVGWWAESDGTPYTSAKGTTVRTCRGDLFRIMEWYGWSGRPNTGLNMLAKEIAQGIRQREFDNGILDDVDDGVADASIYTIVNGNSIGFDMENDVILDNGTRTRGVFFRKSDKSKGSRVMGWQKMRTMFKNSIVRRAYGPLARQMTSPESLYIFNTCEQFCRTVPVLMRSDKYIDDIDTNCEDHIADETRYRVLHGAYKVKSSKVVGHF